MLDSENYMIYKGKPGKRVMKNVPHLGPAFIINKNVIESFQDFYSPSERISNGTQTKPAHVLDADL